LNHSSINVGVQVSLLHTFNFASYLLMAYLIRCISEVAERIVYIMSNEILSVPACLLNCH
jgi:hypothetical protein